MVENGTKRQTIRKRRKDGNDPRPEHLLFFYTGQRTKQCRKIGEGRCISVDEIVIYETGIVLSGKWLTALEEEKLTAADGFDTSREFYEFFNEEYGLPLWGLLIKWDPIN